MRTSPDPAPTRQVPGTGARAQPQVKACRAGAARCLWRLGAVVVLLGVAPAYGAGDEAAACLQSQAGAAQTITHCTAAMEAKDLSDDRRAALYTQRGLARMASGELDRAREDFDAAIGLDGNSSWAYNARAVSWMQKGEVDRAIPDYERAVQLRPGYAFAWTNLGNARLVRGDIDRALSDLDQAVRLAPLRVEIALTGRGRARLARGDYDRALEDFAAALQANPKFANALSGRGQAHFCLGAFDAAADDFRSERQLRKDDESALDLLIAVRRGGHDGRAEQAELAKGYDAQQGLPPGLALFSGTITPEQALQASSDRDPKVQRERRCAASFQVGEWYLLQSDPGHARPYLAAARETCDASRGEYAAAGAELSRLK